MKINSRQPTARDIFLRENKGSLLWYFLNFVSGSWFTFYHQVELYLLRGLIFIFCSPASELSNQAVSKYQVRMSRQDLGESERFVQISEKSGSRMMIGWNNKKIEKFVIFLNRIQARKNNFSFLIFDCFGCFNCQGQFKSDKIIGSKLVEPFERGSLYTNLFAPVTSP